MNQKPISDLRRRMWRPSPSAASGEKKLFAVRSVPRIEGANAFPQSGSSTEVDELHTAIDGRGRILLVF